MRMAFGAATIALVAATPAGALESVRVGVLDHNVGVLNAKTEGREQGVNIEAQADLGRLEALRWVGRPAPYAVASINTAGDTSFAGVGLTWRVPLGANWGFEPALGYVIHNGEVSNPFPNGDARATAFSNDNLLFGSRDLFRTTLGLTRDLPGPMFGELFYNHLSHGQILGNGRNQGVDQVGVRIGYAFGQ